MYIAADSLDDLLLKVYKQILERGITIKPSKGDAREISGILLKLSAPRARLSRSESRGLLFSCLGELLWILAGSDRLDFIQHYIPGYDEFSDDQKTIYGAYGPRLFGKVPNDQVPRVIQLLKDKRDSRQAVLQLFDRTDTLTFHKDVPCTCTLQFMVRDSRLHMLTSMRSNDAWLGLPHDVFTFTMIQELVARSVGIELGEYKHAVGSLHLYNKHQDKALRFVSEGWQTRRPMPPMPKGDPWASVKSLVAFEKKVRTGHGAMPTPPIDPYWEDLATLLSIHKASRVPNNQPEIRRLKRRIHDDVYSTYIKRHGKLLSEKDQLSIFNGSTAPIKEPA
ncbi:thymidylate synthase [Ottowia beijingensis]|uniref:thymidylate synthase n=1 Tax=Ottowia beijingensis TaxID=1207057 RepID=A0A853IXS4_9BURK|nr:thymidylate synthase [Ottowia beijingensis]NZA01239.1 thymidylate synthase [Ottowia beijingensis]